MQLFVAFININILMKNTSKSLHHCCDAEKHMFKYRCWDHAQDEIEYGPKAPMARVGISNAATTHNIDPNIGS